MNMIWVGVWMLIGLILVAGGYKLATGKAVTV